MLGGGGIGAWVAAGAAARAAAEAAAGDRQNLRLARMLNHAFKEKNNG